MRGLLFSVLLAMTIALVVSYEAPEQTVDTELPCGLTDIQALPVISYEANLIDAPTAIFLPESDFLHIVADPIFQKANRPIQEANSYG